MDIGMPQVFDEKGVDGTMTTVGRGFFLKLAGQSIDLVEAQ